MGVNALMPPAIHRFAKKMDPSELGPARVPDNIVRTSGKPDVRVKPADDERRFAATLRALGPALRGHIVGGIRPD